MNENKKTKKKAETRINVPLVCVRSLNAPNKTTTKNSIHKNIKLARFVSFPKIKQFRSKYNLLIDILSWLAHSGLVERARARGAYTHARIKRARTFN